MALQIKNNNNIKQTKEDLAIVGIGCRYPGDANSPEELWFLLARGKDGFKPIPKSRWNSERFSDTSKEIKAKMYTQEAAFLDDSFVFEFDAEFFNFPAREADFVDPQQRMLHEITWECLEDAQIPPQKLSGQNIGVYVGAFTTDSQMLRNQFANLSQINQFSATSSTYTMLSNRLSYFYNLKGPSLTIDTACSASMVALNYACQDLWAHNTDGALIAGVNSLLLPVNSCVMSAGGFLSPHSRSKAFDATADGYARGEGAGAIFVKRLSDAIKDKDSIYAVIKGISVNQDGKTTGIAAPNGQAQQTLIEKVIKDSHLNTEDVVFVEAHGTGTALGDPTEVSALAGALGPRQDEAKRYISSIKGNIGHQEGGAGIAGIIKAALVLKKKQVPPQSNFNRLNPALDMKGGSFEVTTRCAPLPDAQGQALACINAFGYGGTNGHAVLAEYNDTVSDQGTDDNDNIPSLVCLSANDRESLLNKAAELSLFLEENPEISLSQFSHMLLDTRETLDQRMAFVAPSRQEALSILKTFSEGGEPSQLIEEGFVGKAEKGCVFIYTGMGPQWWAMGRMLYETMPVFKKAVHNADDAFVRHSGWSILEEMLKPEADSLIHKNEIAQPANFILQHGLSELLSSWGLNPAAIIGHSVGEINACLRSGAITLDEAAKLAFHRSRLQQTKAGQGRMMATGLDLEMAQQIASLYENHVSIGAINSPHSVALAGDIESLESIAEELKENGIFGKLIYGEIAYHSHQMDGLEKELLSALEGLQPVKPALPLFSTVTGKAVSSEIHVEKYWWQNVRQPVLFDKALRAALKEGYRHFIEIGPNPVLSGAIQQVGADFGTKDLCVVSSLVRQQDEHQSLLQSLARFWCNGISIETTRQSPQHHKLPLYSWKRQYHWNESKISKEFRAGRVSHPLCGNLQFSPEPVWERELSMRTLGILADHKIQQKSVFPAAGYVEAFLQAIKDKVDMDHVTIGSISFEKMLNLPAEGTLQVRIEQEGNTLIFYARTYEADGNWSRYATATVLSKPLHAASVQMEKYISEAEKEQIAGTELYPLLAEAGLHYDEAFQVIESAYKAEGFVEAVLRSPEKDLCLENVHVQPSLLDGVLQLLALFAPDKKNTALPVSIDRISFFQHKIGSEIYAYAKETSCSEFFIQADILICDRNRVPLAFLKGVKAQKIAGVKGKIVEHYQMVWNEADSFISDNIPAAIKLVGAETERTSKVASFLKLVDDNARTILWLAPSLTENEILPNIEQGLQLTEFCSTLSPQEPHKLIVCTQNVWAVNNTDICNPAHGDLWGIARTIRRECPHIEIACLDLDEEIPANFSQIITSLNDGEEVAIRDGKIWRHVLQQVDLSNNHIQQAVPYNDEHGFELVPERQGGLDGLNYHMQVRRVPVGDEVEVKIDSVALNFKDVLKVYGRLKAQTLENSYSGDSLGLEAHGVITRTGKEASWSIGEEVIISPKDGAFKRYTTFSPDDAIILKVSHLPISARERSTIIIAFATAHYCLKDAARLRKGEKVLIHSASGGVGHAAIQVARFLGAEIYATAGSEEKVQHLKTLGIDKVFNSRTLDFEQQIMDATNGEGIDVVLNFLPGELLHASIRLLAPFGRHIEIGKADIGANQPMPLGEFERNLSFIAFDFDNIIKVKKSLAYEIMNEVIDQIVQKVYRPDGIEVFSANDIKDVFRELAGGHHIGKRVIDMTDTPLTVNPPIAYKKQLLKQATYLVTGAFGGLGFKLVDWLISAGAGAVIMCGRTIRDGEALEALRLKAKEKGCQLIEKACDIGNEQVVQDLMDEHWPFALRGIFHAAAVLADAPLEQQNEETFQTSYHAKAMGAYYLHKYSLTQDLDFYVMFSSISATLGNPSQANYAGANSYLDALATYRRQQGLAGSSIALGALDDVGMVASNQGIERILSARGIHPIQINKALSAIENLLQFASSNIGIFDVDWKKWNKNATISSREPAFILVSSDEDIDENMPILEQIRTLAKPEATELINRFLIAELSKVLRRSVDKFRTDQTLSDAGLDSLMVVELQIALDAGFPSILPPDMVDMQQSIESLSETIFNAVQEKGAAVTDDTDELDNLSDEDVDAMLETLLNENAENDQTV